ncbi:MAG: universal stress protein [Chthoniobacterales bacterium]
MKTATIKTPKKSLHPARRSVARDLTLRTILVPTDFSTASLKAMEYARLLSQAFHAAVHLVNVFDVQFEAPGLAPLYATDTEVERRLRRRLHDVATVFASAIQKGRCHARIGRAFHEICETARKLHADIIVTATHGHTGLKHLLIGSTAERIVRHAPCPVLVVRDKGHQLLRRKNGDALPKQPHLQIKHILIPIDFSEHSRAALRYAVALAKRFGAKVTLLNVVYPQYYATNAEYMVYDYALLLDETRKSAKRNLMEFVRNTAFQGVPFTTRVIEGHPGQKIVEYAKKHGADMIVNATHGRTGLAHVLLGSTAEHIVRYGKCPVLVVPRLTKPK